MRVELRGVFWVPNFFTQTLVSGYGDPGKLTSDIASDYGDPMTCISITWTPQLNMDIEGSDTSQLSMEIWAPHLLPRTLNPGEPALNPLLFSYVF